MKQAAAFAFRALLWSVVVTLRIAFFVVALAFLGITVLLATHNK